MSEPKSLFGGPHRTNSSSKKRKILGLPFDYSQQDSKSKKDPCKFFDLGLETVHENVKDKNCATIDVKDTKKDDYNRNLSHNKNSITKKVVNGNIVQSLGSKIVQVMPNGFDQTKLRLRKASQGYSGQYSADVSNRCMSDSKNPHQLESKSSFTSVAQQILNNSSISSNERSNQNSSYNYMAFDSAGQGQKPSFFDPAQPSSSQNGLRNSKKKFSSDYSFEQFGQGLIQQQNIPT